jgi:carbon storage regulator
MLVLSRKVGESIQIAGDIRVTITQVRGGRVRLSISAPSSVRIAREEILLGPDGDLTELSVARGKLCFSRSVS